MDNTQTPTPPTPTTDPAPTPNPAAETPEQKKANNRRVLIAAIIIAVVLILVPVIFAVITFINQATKDTTSGSRVVTINKEYYAKDVSERGYSVYETDEFPIKCVTFRTKESYSLTIYGKSTAHCSNATTIVDEYKQ